MNEILSRRAPRLAPALLVLLAPVLLVACHKPQQWVRLGAPFDLAAPPPGRARVYVYWPAASSPPGGAYAVTNGESFSPLLPGGFSGFLVAPGTSPFRLERLWDVHLGLDAPASASMILSEAPQTIEAGRVYFLKVRSPAGLLGRPQLVAVPPGVGQGEAGRCREMATADDKEIERRLREAVRDRYSLR
ncbi:MAG TPA: hypothetical protein VGR07_22920 [Thermoanaerobaculia bacterium]|jgi:hypothetical protein|nr:hypothetical protein [Thermoanaerobaculia bacterium]